MGKKYDKPDFFVKPEVRYNLTRPGRMYGGVAPFSYGGQGAKRYGVRKGQGYASQGRGQTQSKNMGGAKWSPGDPVLGYDMLDGKMTPYIAKGESVTRDAAGNEVPGTRRTTSQTFIDPSRLRSNAPQFSYGDGGASGQQPRQQQRVSKLGAGGGAVKQRAAQMQQQQPQPQQQGGYDPALAMAYQKAQDEAKAANEKRYNDILQGYNDIAGQATDRYMANLQGNDARYGQGMDYLNGLYSWASQGLDERHQQRVDDAMKYLKGQGKAAKGQINQNWRNASSRVGQDMVSRGLTGSTIAPTMQMAVERNRSADLQSLNENLNRQYMNAYAGLTGDQLSEASRMAHGALGMNTGMVGSHIGAAQGLDASYNGTMNSLGGSRLGFMERREDVYPDFSGMMNMYQQYGNFGGGAYPAPMWGGGQQGQPQPGGYAPGQQMRPQQPYNTGAANLYGNNPFRVGGGMNPGNGMPQQARPQLARPGFRPGTGQIAGGANPYARLQPGQVQPGPVRTNPYFKSRG